MLHATMGGGVCRVMGRRMWMFSRAAIPEWCVGGGELVVLVLVDWRRGVWRRGGLCCVETGVGEEDGGCGCEGEGLRGRTFETVHSCK